MASMSTAHNKPQEEAERKMYQYVRTRYIHLVQGKSSTSTIHTAGVLSIPIKVAPSRGMVASLSEATDPPQTRDI